jgi:hypothetical protein
MTQSAVEWFLTEFKKQVWFEPDSELDIWIKELIPKAKEMEKKQKLEKQLFIGKVSEIIGFDKTVELLRESKQAIEKI